MTTPTIINNELPISTCSVCEDLDYCKILRHFKLKTSIYAVHRCDSLESFFTSFSETLQIEVEDLKAAIRSHYNDESFIALSKLEFGINLAEYSTLAQKSILANIGAVAEHYKKEIHVFCSDLCLSFVHKGRNGFIIRPSDNVFNGSIACLVSEINVVHSVIMNDTHDYLQYQFTVVRYNDAVQEPVAEDSNTNVTLPAELPMVDEFGGEVATDNIENVNLENANSENAEVEVAQDFQRLTLEQLLITPIEDINNQTYTSTSGLDFPGSQPPIEMLEHKITYDVDGFFGFLDLEEFGSAINCPVRFAITPSVSDPRTLKNIQKLLSTSEETFTNAVSFGKVELPVGALDLIVVLTSSRKLADNLVSGLTRTCAQFARSLQCERDAGHYANCPSVLLRDGHQSTMRASTSSHQRDEMETYNEAVASCYIHHFKEMLFIELEKLNVRSDAKVFFKNVSSKSATRSSTVKNCLESVDIFKLAFKLNKLDYEKVFVDFCVASTAFSNNPVFGKVRIN